MPDATLSILYVLPLVILTTTLQSSINGNLISILEIKELRIREIYPFSQHKPLVEVGSEHRSVALKIKICPHPTRSTTRHPLQEKVSIKRPHPSSGLQIRVNLPRPPLNVGSP